MVNRELKQVIVMRTDLNMRKGKMIAQGAHAAVMGLVNPLLRPLPLQRGQVNDTGTSAELVQWLTQGMKKVCVRCESEAELLDIEKRARDAGLTVHLVTDAGLTEFDGPTKTCLAIGPNKSEDVDKITGELKLL